QRGVHAHRPLGALLRARLAVSLPRRARDRTRAARMIALWFALLAFTLILFVVLDGWNIGAGVLHLLVARTQNDRRRVVAALGPLWSWHEVWLIAAGGGFFLGVLRARASGVFCF